MQSQNNYIVTASEDTTEVISVVEGGLELQEEYFHSKAELRRVLREFGFDEVAFG
jgi:hypothetical protein